MHTPTGIFTCRSKKGGGNVHTAEDLKVQVFNLKETTKVMVGFAFFWKKEGNIRSGMHLGDVQAEKKVQQMKSCCTHLRT